MKWLEIAAFALKKYVVLTNYGIMVLLACSLLAINYQW